MPKFPGERIALLGERLNFQGNALDFAVKISGDASPHFWAMLKFRGERIGLSGKRLNFRGNALDSWETLKFLGDRFRSGKLMACNRKIGTSCSLVGAVYDRPQSRK